MTSYTMTIPVAITCAGCDERIGTAWEAPLPAKGKMPDASGALAELQEAARGAGWTMSGSVAVCPRCAAGMAAGDVVLPAPSSAGEAIDQLMVARAVRNAAKGA